ncbi:UNVERIFIED_CONTAM: hypothetical protein HDU68_005768 [Siphonaria sp. JEL0065]|nr:hypothetical protein HDU68_005768 [Siphonaria sp. JEL0065]
MNDDAHYPSDLSDQGGSYSYQSQRHQQQQLQQQQIPPQPQQVYLPQQPQQQRSNRKRQQLLKNDEKSERNRIAQRAHQHRKKQRIQELQEQVQHLTQWIGQKRAATTVPLTPNQFEAFMTNTATNTTTSASNSSSSKSNSAMSVSNLLNSEEDDAESTSTASPRSGTPSASLPLGDLDSDQEANKALMKDLPADVRRKLQNRLAQRKSRALRNQQIQLLEQEVQQLTEKYTVLCGSEPQQILFNTVLPAQAPDVHDA